MDNLGGTIKNVVFRQFKSSKIVINSPIEFCDATNNFVPSIKCLYQPEASLLEESRDTENAPVIPNTLETHRLVREVVDGKAISDIDPVHVKDYKNILKCNHIEKEFQSLTMMANKCACCMKVLGVKRIQKKIG